MAQRATQSIVMHAPSELVYAVVVDFERYHEWVSDLKRVTVLEHDDTGRALEVEYRAAAFGRSTTYVLRYDYARAPEVVSWTQSSGDLTSLMNGQYRFTDVTGGTRVTYELEVELLVPIPTFVRTRAASRIQDQALRELRSRVESLR